MNFYKVSAQKKSQLEKLIFCRATVVFKLLGKTMFQVPKPTHICILGGLEAVQACAKNKNRNLNNCFSAKPNYIP